MLQYMEMMKNMSKRFYPSINNIHFQNFDIVEDSTNIKHIRGDLYLNSECIGYYNPVYQTGKDTPTQYFLRLEDSFQYLYEKEGKYESLFNKKALPLSEYDCSVGLQELIADLEIITYLYEFMRNICPKTDFSSLGLVGIINGTNETPKINIIQIKDSNINTGNQIIDFINDKVDSIKLNPLYPILIFRCEKDFEIFYVEGKKIDIVESENIYV